MDERPHLRLNYGQIPNDYKSFESLAISTEDQTLTEDHKCDLEREHGHYTESMARRILSPDSCGLATAANLSQLPMEVPLKQLVSGSPIPADPDLSSLRETDKDPLAGGPRTCGLWLEGLMPIYVASLTVAIGITIAMVLQIYFGTDQVRQPGMLVTDHEHCTTLGREVLLAQGSSVDAAVVAALCLGIIHPHASGIGGGGVMLVHDIRNNESRVIDFQNTAPSALQEDMLQHDLDQKLGLLVGVPGMLRGLYHAHKLYGRLPWEALVHRAARVARDGFNVSHSLAEAISKLKGQNLSERFMDMFLPGGHALAPGSLLKIPILAAILDAGVSEFYNGNLSLELTEEVQANGGVLTEADVMNYSVVVGKPVSGLYQGFRVLVPPPPSLGAAIISTLNILESFHVNGNTTISSAHHWIVESLKAALAMASGLGDPVYDSSVSELLSKMLSQKQAAELHQMISDTHASPPERYSLVYPLQRDSVTSQVVVMGPDDIIVSVASSLGRSFGSRLIIPSGIILNSQIMAFSWPNTTQGQLPPNPKNRIQSGKRPTSFLMPTIVMPSYGKCGIYVALCSSNGDYSLSGITQILINVLTYHDTSYHNTSLSQGRLHPLLEPNHLLVDSKFLEEDVQVLRLKGHVVDRVKVLSPVQGIQRTNDMIKALVEPLQWNALESSP